MTDNDDLMKELASMITSEVPDVQKKNTWTIEEILDAVAQMYRNYFVMPEVNMRVLAVCIALTHVFRAFYIVPYVFVKSPDPSSGKTNIMYLAEELVSKPLLTESPSLAAYSDAVDEGCTAMLDEMDNMLKKKSSDLADILAIINSGYKSKGKRIKMGGPNYTTRIEQSTFGPKWFCGIIAKLPPATHSRCIDIVVDKATREEMKTVNDFFHLDVANDARPIREQLGLWAELAVKELHGKRVPTPDWLDARTREIWEPLLLIASTASERWHKYIWDACIYLSSNKDAEDKSFGAMMLHDIRSVLKPNEDKIFSSQIVERLKAIEGAVWSDMSNGKGLNKNIVAKTLKNYKVYPEKTTIRIGEEVLRGYLVDSFTDAFKRYLDPIPPEEDVTTLQTGTDYA